MKKSLTIALALLTLGGLSAALYFTNSSSTKQTASNEDVATSSPAETTTNETSNTTDTTSSVLALDKSEVNSIEVTVGSNTLNYVAGEENWSLEGYEDYLLDQSGLNYKAKLMLQVEAARTIENANLSEYGLDNPSKKATYHLKDGSTINLSVGNLSLDQVAVYVMLDNDPTTVYVVDSMLYNCMIGDIEAYRTKELENYETSSIHDITISGKDMENIALKLSAVQNGFSLSYDLSTDTMPDALANTYSVDQLISSLPSFTVSHFVADHVTDLSAYGLDDPTLHLVINYYDGSATNSGTPSSDTEFEIIGQVDYIWGNILENGEIAFMKSGDTSVYSMDATFLTNFKECANTFFLSSKYIAMPYITDVTAIDVAFDDASYHMTVDEANGKYTLANQDMDKATFKKLYRNLCSLMAEIELDTPATGDETAACTIVYSLSDGTNKTVTLSPSTNSQYYQTYLNDALLVGVTKTQVDNLKETLKAASNGEEFNDIY